MALGAEGPVRLGLRHGRRGQRQQHGLAGLHELALQFDGAGQEATGVVNGRIVPQRRVDQFPCLRQRQGGAGALAACPQQRIAQQAGAGFTGLEQQARQIGGQQRRLQAGIGAPAAQLAQGRAGGAIVQVGAQPCQEALGGRVPCGDPVFRRGRRQGGEERADLARALCGHGAGQSEGTGLRKNGRCMQVAVDGAGRSGVHLQPRPVGRGRQRRLPRQERAEQRLETGLARTIVHPQEAAEQQARRSRGDAPGHRLGHGPHAGGGMTHDVADRPRGAGHPQAQPGVPVQRPVTGQGGVIGIGIGVRDRLQRIGRERRGHGRRGGWRAGQYRRVAPSTIRPRPNYACMLSASSAA
ncbi:hypothetical protein ACLPLH_16775 [Achromobacter xylosoxidans]|uniref:hypothetical protein n=1 Tax=Alcaligenes xylosoxydans xylosoxydans TaxID=85698 RepID=UPI0006BFCC3A|nr:hypothetical protein [Achromobacter xylosoxidans]CUJ85131.1 Uncharacterised protein [Achromobacter xylosoxidans]